MANIKKIKIKSSTDELELFANVYIPDVQPKAIVQIIHGMAEHKERYNLLASLLCRYGYVVVCADNRGHGESVSESIPKGYFADENGWLVNLKDIHQFSSKLLEIYPSLPFFVIGHSMGSLIAHSYLKRFEDSVDGIIFSGMPAYNKSTPAGLALAKTLKKIKNPRKVSKTLVNASDYNKTIKNPRTSFDWLSYNEENVDKYIADPNCGFPFTIGGYYDLLNGMNDVFVADDWRVLKKNLPILFLVGEDDPCADVPTGFKKSLNNLHDAGYDQIEANIYENMRHEIFNEDENKVVIKNVIVWLDDKVTKLSQKA